VRKPLGGDTRFDAQGAIAAPPFVTTDTVQIDVEQRAP
jgi:hypothetical protein